MLQQLSGRLFLLIPLFLSLAVHEWAHAYCAWKLGDDTAKRLGRLTLNPLAHIDLFGTVLLPLLGIPFGWAKPVPFNPVRFSGRINMTFGSALVAVCGPLSNFIMACLCAIILACCTPALLSAPLILLFHQLVILNVVLAFFNLLPIPPLDGSHLVEACLPRTLLPFWHQLARFGPFALLLLLFGVPGLGVNLFYLPQQAAQLLLRLALGS